MRIGCGACCGGGGAELYGTCTVTAGSGYEVVTGTGIDVGALSG